MKNLHHATLFCATAVFAMCNSGGWAQTMDYPLQAAPISAVELAPPASWRLLYQEDGAWKEVPQASAYAVAADMLNRVHFAPVETTALRIEAQLQPSASGGILEWAVE